MDSEPGWASRKVRKSSARADQSTICARSHVSATSLDSRNRVPSGRHPSKLQKRRGKLLSDRAAITVGSRLAFRFPVAALSADFGLKQSPRKGEFRSCAALKFTESRSLP